MVRSDKSEPTRGQPSAKPTLRVDLIHSSQIGDSCTERDEAYGRFLSDVHALVSSQVQVKTLDALAFAAFHETSELESNWRNLYTTLAAVASCFETDARSLAAFARIKAFLFENEDLLTIPMRVASEHSRFEPFPGH